ncbi:MAG: extracellular solute-binding protein [Clostridia bacterium]|nr:extracellular solute-binding protein [Clostridia bacterium]
MMNTKRMLSAALLLCLLGTLLCPAFSLAAKEETITLRICNWEEYIDQGDWGEDEVIDLESGDIFGENSLVDDFETWYEETYGKKVHVEYSTFGTNEDLYNMLTIGDVYDLVCPSEYMIMKLMAEDKVQPLSEDFFDGENENNYYIRGVSPYIRNIFETHDIGGVTWDKCAAGYMWGVTGFLYNPEVLEEENAATWNLLENRDYNRQITMKDNVRDAYFAAVGALKSEKLTSEDFTSREDYVLALQDEMNDVSQETVDAAQEYLQKIRDNLYSFETDSGKADMITGKVVANYQWSGDAVYAMDTAEEDDYILNFAVPQECTNIYFDGWIMLKSGINGNAEKQQAAEAFINFISRPDNVIRNMYYIGYTSAISGGEDERIFEYLDWNYGAEEDEEEVVDYPVGYFFAGEEDNEDYVLSVPEEQLHRQLSAQYPSQEVIRRASIMVYFNEEQSERINRMWIRIRCFNIQSVPVWVWIAIGAVIILGVLFGYQRKLSKQRQYS